MPRHDGADTTYEVADRFVDVALRRDDSLFTPGRSIWSRANLEELDRRYVQNPDLSAAGFEDKLKQQLEGASADAYQLMGEILFVYYLPAHYNISGDTKRQRLMEVLSWSPSPVDVPADLLAVLNGGVGSGGPGFHLYKWASLAFLITFARQWKLASPDTRTQALSDPWRFRDFVAQVPTEGGGIYGREALLHLVFPDTFERIFSGTDKWRVTNELKALVDDPDTNADRKIWQIRQKLVARFGSDFDFYDTDGVRALWKRYDSPLDEFIYWSSRFYELDAFEAGERTYKLEIVKRLTAAKEGLLSGGDWFPLLKRAFASPNNLTPWQVHDAFLKWCQEDMDRAAKLLHRVWDAEADPLERLADFFSHFPRDAVSGLGSRTTLGSFLMLAIDPYTYPPYRVAAMHAAYRLAKFEAGDEHDEISMYRAALAFFDRLRERGGERGLQLRDRLDAQLVIWCVANWPTPPEWPAEDQAAFDKYREGGPGAEDYDGGDGGHEPEPDVQPPADPLTPLADELLLDRGSLAEMADLLRSKGQIILYGPPGTGKTFVARKLAVALAGDPTRVRLVQFHPSYAYEDFVEGFRPRRLEGGQPGFELVAGPLRTLAQRATEDPGHDYFLIIDEINRGNIAKVFGELYFLLEYRDEEMQLQYSPDKPFRLPGNLRIIGTMNTADRSIALLDAALRRRFSFVPFFPDKPPIEGLLLRWLRRHRPDMVWVASVVDSANSKLADRNAAIGPSFFLRSDLDEKKLALVWEHEILPLLEDYFFEDPERVSAFQLAGLRKELMAAAAQAAPQEADTSRAVAEEPADYSTDSDTGTEPTDAT